MKTNKIMNMKKLIIFSTIGIGLIIALLYACSEDFLETVPTGSANNVILANAKGVDMLLTGAYAGIDGTPTTSGSLPGSVSNWVFGGFASDDAYKGQGQGGEAQSVPIELYTADAATPYLEGRWSVDYNTIQRANDVLRVMEQATDIPEAKKTLIKAQALFIRGFMHFEAIRVFNYIPYITETDVASEVPNTDPNVAWAGIESDLKFAYENLPPTWADVGRATRYAAAAVLAKVYIFQKKWDNAKPLLDAIITSEQYELMDNFEDNFMIAHRNNKESIFEIQYSIFDGSSGNANAGYGQYAVNGMISVDGMISCCGGYQPSQTLVNAFQVDPATGLPSLDKDTLSNLKNDMGIESYTYFVQDTVTPVDPRLDYTVGRRGVPFLDVGVMRGKSWIREQAYGGPYINRKYQFKKSDIGINSNTSGWATGLNVNNYRAVRYAHVLLLRAEVAAETGDLPYATELVNEIRNRAANNVVMGRCRTFELLSQDGLNVDYSVPAANYLINPYPATFPDIDYARKAIYAEQRLELAMEGFRFFDLVRWGLAEKYINLFIKQDSKFRNYLGGSVFQKKHEYWPVPQTQLDLQPDVLIQNPLWE